MIIAVNTVPFVKMTFAELDEMDRVLAKRYQIMYHHSSKTTIEFRTYSHPIEWLNKDAESRFYKPKVESVKLMTLHSCKGLEFVNVIIPGLGYTS